MTVFSECSLQETAFPEFNINLNYAVNHISKPDTIKYVMWYYVGGTGSAILLSRLWFNSGFVYYLAESTADWPITGTAQRTNTSNKGQHTKHVTNILQKIDDTNNNKT
jgi:hypothetical protein